MSWFEEFKKAYDDYPTQDNEGFVPDRGGFKCGFGAAWNKQQEKIILLETELNTAKEWERSSKPMYIKWNTDLNAKLQEMLKSARQEADFRSVSHVAHISSELDDIRAERDDLRMKLDAVKYILNKLD